MGVCPVVLQSAPSKMLRPSLPSLYHPFPSPYLVSGAAQFVLCLHKFRNKVDGAIASPGTQVVELDSLGTEILRVPDERRPNIKVGPEDGAYAIYTSVTDILHAFSVRAERHSHKKHK